MRLLWHWHRTILRVLLAMGILLAGMVAVLMLIEVPLAPWARSFGLWRTLTGNWHGELRTADGRVSFVYLEIRGDVLRLGARGLGRSLIGGSARWCDDSHRLWDYEIWGNPDNWRGTRFHLSTRGTVQRDSGFALGALQGEWSGDKIRASVALVSLARTATAEASRAARREALPPARIALRRGGEPEFLAECAAR